MAASDSDDDGDSWVGFSGRTSRGASTSMSSSGTYDYRTFFGYPPSYEERHGHGQDQQAANIILNPGLAFETGSILEYGTGTGVLGIAALKMGAALSTGIDIDPQAVSSARENMLLNGMDSNTMRVDRLDCASGVPFGVVKETEFVHCNFL